MGSAKVSSTRKITVVAIMSALSAVLMFIEFSIPLMPSFIKLDISDLPALITSFAYGPVWGILVCLLKNLIHLCQTQTAGIGELSNFLLSASFVLVAGIFYQIKRNRKFAIIGSLVGSLSMAIMAFAVNFLLIYPLYMKFMMPEEVILGLYQEVMPSVNSLWKAILIFNVPFTFVKGLISVAITFAVYPHLSPILKGRKKRQ